MTTALLLTADDLERTIARALDPLRVQLEQLRKERSGDPVPIPEAARRLGVTVRTVERWLKAGELRAVPIGGRRYVVLPDASGNR